MKPSVFIPMWLMFMTVTVSCYLNDDNNEHDIIAMIKKRQREEAAKEVTDQERLKDLKFETQCCDNDYVPSGDEDVSDDDDTPKDAIIPGNIDSPMDADTPENIAIPKVNTNPKNVATPKDAAAPEDDSTTTGDVGGFATLDMIHENKSAPARFFRLYAIVLGFLFFISIAMNAYFLYLEYREAIHRRHQYHSIPTEYHADNPMTGDKHCITTPSQWY